MIEMKKKQARIAITPSPELIEALEKFSKASGMPVATLCRNLLHEAIPAIDAMTNAYLVAFADPEKALKIMQVALFENSEIVEELKTEVQQTLDNFDD